MNTNPIVEKQSGELVRFPSKNKKDNVSKMPKFKKDGTEKKVLNNSVKGKGHEVYPIKDKKDIEAIKDYFRTKILTAANEEDKKIYARNLMMWIVSINVGLRMSDIVKWQWKDILYSDNTFKDSIRIQEKKTDKYKEFFLNTNCIDAIKEYIDTCNIDTKPNNYVFYSREDGHICVDSVCKIIKEAGKNSGIKYNLGTHTCRKTWAYQQIIAHQNDSYFLAHLMNLLNHSSVAVTLRYAGLESEQTKQYYNDVNL